MIRKILAISLVVLVLAKLLVFPRFRALKQRVDLAVNVTLVLLAVTYGVQLIQWYLDRR